MRSFTYILRAALVLGGLLASAPSEGAKRSAADTDVTLTSGPWTLYTTAVSEINCVVEQGADIWLGTEFGVKHIDHATKKVTQFTQADGLPGSRVTAMTMDAGSVYCTVESPRNGAPTISLCRFNPASCRWAELRTTPLRGVSFTSGAENAENRYFLGSSVESSFIACTPERVCFAAGSIAADSRAAFQVYDKRLQDWRSFPIDPAFQNGHRYLNLYGMVAERYALWMATNTGLLRYDLPGKRWKRFLPDQIVHALSLGPLHSIWAIVYQPDSPRLGAPAVSPLRSPTDGHWTLAHVDTKSGAITSVPLFPMDPRFAGTDFVPGALVATETEVQVSGVFHPLASGHTPPALRDTIVCRLDRKNGQWRIIYPEDPASFHTVRSLLCKPVLPGCLLANLYPDHFPGWYWASTPFPHLVSEALSSRSQTFWELDGERVSVVNGKTLVCTDLKTEKVKQIEFPAYPLKKIGFTHALAIVGNLLYVVMDDALYVNDLALGIWKPIPLPITNANASDYRLVCQADTMWIGARGLARRCSLKGATCVPSSVEPGKLGELLGTDSTGAWFMDANARDTVIHDNVESHKIKTLVLEASGDIPVGPMNQTTALKSMGDTIWCRISGVPLQGSGTVTRQCIAGYDWKTKMWTAPQWLNAENETVSLFEDGGKVLAAMDMHSAGLYAYDSAARTWSEVIASQPPRKAADAAMPLTIISADAREFWFSSHETASLFRFDKSAQIWTEYQYPKAVSVLAREQGCVRHGEDIYCSTYQGVWRFNISAHTWIRMTGPDIFDYSIVEANGNADTIWTVLQTNPGGQTFAARLDRRTGAWRFYSEAEGFPGFGPPRLFFAPPEVWVIEFGFVHRLDPDGLRWSEMTENLLKASLSAPMGMDFTPDRKTAWFLLCAPEGSIDGAPKGPRPAETVVVRYDIASGATETYRPDPKWNEFGGMIQVDGSSVDVVTEREDERGNPKPSHLYQLNPVTKSWRDINIPPEFSTVPFHPRCMMRQGDSVWFMSPSAVFRWKDH